MTLTIRTATTETNWAEGLSVLERVYVGEGYSAPDRARTVYRREALASEGTFLVAALDERVIGAVLFLRPDSAMRQVARPGEREFRLLAVHPDARGAGICQALVEACVERSRGAEGLVLWTRPVMRAAQRLYERTGFTRVPERDMDDPRGFRRLVYRRALP